MELSLEQIIEIAKLCSEIEKLTSMLGTVYSDSVDNEKLFNKIKGEIEELYSKLCSIGGSRG